MSAISSAAKSAPKTIPPSSSFGELLRRSKFATYDPAIRQAYAAPPSYIHRGNWGLKRPINNHSRRSAIVLRKFEEHAQYIEWNRAEHQVKMLKAVEEMNITPTLVPQTSWFIGLGQAATATETGFDSDFCPGESPRFDRVKDQTRKETIRVLDKPLKDEAVWESFMPTSNASSSKAAETEAKNLGHAALGKGGKGAYGAKAPPPKSKKEPGDDDLLQPNIHSMTPPEFEKYVERLRKLRPQFIEYLRENLQKDWDNSQRCLVGVDPSTVSDAELVFLFGTEARLKYLHMAFLGRYTNEHLFKESSGSLDAIHAENAKEHAEDLANRSSAIRKQPHKLGGLMYAHPTLLETSLSVKPSSGLVLQDANRTNDTRRETTEYIAAFAGMTSRLQKAHAGSGVKPLYDPIEGGLVAPRVPDPSDPSTIHIDSSKSEKKMRLISLQLEDTPRVIGLDVSNSPLSTTRLRSKVVVDGAVVEKGYDNPYTPGSREYIGFEKPMGNSMLAPGQSTHLAKLAALSYRRTNAPKMLPSSIKGALPKPGMLAGGMMRADVGQTPESRDNILDTLTKWLPTKPAANPSKLVGFRGSKAAINRDEAKKDEKKDS